MASNTKASSDASQIGGTQSPPLEATGEHRTMGVSSIDGSVSKPAKDTEARGAYFSESDKQQFDQKADEESPSPEKIKTD